RPPPEPTAPPSRRTVLLPADAGRRSAARRAAARRAVAASSGCGERRSQGASNRSLREKSCDKSYSVPLSPDSPVDQGRPVRDDAFRACTTGYAWTAHLVQTDDVQIDSVQIDSGKMRSEPARAGARVTVTPQHARQGDDASGLHVGLAA